MKKRLIIILLSLLSVNFIFAQYKTEWKARSQEFTEPQNNACYIDLGQQGIWGALKITLFGTWNGGRTTGFYTKTFDIGYNIGTLYKIQPCNVEAVGYISSNFKIGNPFKDENNHLKIPIYHLNTIRNYVYVFVEMYTNKAVNKDLISLSNNLPANINFTNKREYNSIGTKLGIGTLYPKNKLDVNGTIRANEIIVSNPSTADFVFEKNYKLKSLAEVEKFITQNKHLPDVASAKQMKKNGVKQGEMNAKLLQKIEELTLYMIQLKKETTQLRKENKELKKSNNSLVKTSKALNNRIQKLENKQ